MQKVATKGIREPQDEHEFNEQHFEGCCNEQSGQVAREEESGRRHFAEAAQGPAALLAMPFCGA